MNNRIRATLAYVQRLASKRKRTRPDPYADMSADEMERRLQLLEEREAWMIGPERDHDGVS